MEEKDKVEQTTTEPVDKTKMDKASDGSKIEAPVEEVAAEEASVVEEEAEAPKAEGGNSQNYKKKKH